MKLVMTQSNITLKGGAERVLLKIAQHYKAKIYTAEYSPSTTFPEFSGLDIEIVGRPRLASLLPYGRVSQGLNYGLSFYFLKLKEDYDVINPHMAPSHWVRNLNERVLWYCHSPLRDVWDLYQYRMSLKKLHQKPVYMAGAAAVRAIDRSVVGRIEGILANSQNTYSRLVKYFGRDDAEVLKGCVDYESYSDKGDERYFFYPSRISYNKRQEFAIEAFRRFRNLAGKNGDRYKLVIAGALSKDKFYMDYYERLVKLASNVPGVKILTSMDDAALLRAYSKATAVLYPPVNEDYGLVPLEGMASGKPVIAINEGGPRETVVDGSTGFLVDEPSQMAERMLYISEHPAQAHAMGEAGMRLVRRSYSWDGFFKKFDRAARRVSRMGGSR